VIIQHLCINATETKFPVSFYFFEVISPETGYNHYHPVIAHLFTTTGELSKTSWLKHTSAPVLRRLGYPKR
jgi:hypothetical protein